MVGLPRGKPPREVQSPGTHRVSLRCSPDALHQEVAHACLVRELGVRQLDRKGKPGVRNVVPRPGERGPEVGRIARFPPLGQEILVMAALKVVDIAGVMQLYERESVLRREQTI